MNKEYFNSRALWDVSMHSKALQLKYYTTFLQLLNIMYNNISHVPIYDRINDHMKLN